MDDWERNNIVPCSVLLQQATLSYTKEQGVPVNGHTEEHMNLGPSERPQLVLTLYVYICLLQDDSHYNIKQICTCQIVDYQYSGTSVR